jgi:membrane-associated phospholipid phosphatase
VRGGVGRGGLDPDAQQALATGGRGVSGAGPPVAAAGHHVPDEERIGDRDLAHWPTRPGRRFVALVARVTVLLAGAWRWSLANLALLLTVVVGGVVVFGATVLAAEVYDAVVDRDGLAGLDQPVLDAAVSTRSPTLDQAVTWFTDVGGPVGMPVIALVVVTVLAVRRRSWLPVLLMGVAAAGSVLITVLGKDLAARARPPMALAVPPFETSPSFPSGHTLNATVVLGVSAYLVMLGRKHLRSRVLVASVAAVFVVAMGLSRVWLGHHWLTDVVAGWLVGLAWLATVVTAHRVKVTLDRAQREGRQPVVDRAMTARPASSRATGTRNGEHDT